MAIVVGLGEFDQALISGMLGEKFTFVTHPTEEQLMQAKAALVRADTKVDALRLSRMPHLEIAARTGVGTELVDLVAATAAGVAVSTTPGANSNAVAEGTMAHLLALVKNLRPLTALVQTGGWHERESLFNGDLEGATLGIIGWGRIGKRVATLSQAFGMRVLGYDPAAEVPSQYSTRSLAQLLESADAVSLHIPLTDKTRNLIDRRSLAQMKSGSILINCSRGGLVNLDDALAALRSGQLAGLGLDSFEPEPPEHHPIFDEPNVILTPHLMGLSPRAKQATFQAAVDSIKLHFQGDRTYPIANQEIRKSNERKDCRRSD